MSTARKSDTNWLLWLVVALVIAIALVYLASSQFTGGPA